HLERDQALEHLRVGDAGRGLELLACHLLLEGGAELVAQLLVLALEELLLECLLSPVLGHPRFLPAPGCSIRRRGGRAARVAGDGVETRICVRSPPPPGASPREETGWCRRAGPGTSCRSSRPRRTHLPSWSTTCTAGPSKEGQRIVSTSGRTDTTLDTGRNSGNSTGLPSRPKRHLPL